MALFLQPEFVPFGRPPKWYSPLSPLLFYPVFCLAMVISTIVNAKVGSVSYGGYGHAFAIAVGPAVLVA